MEQRRLITTISVGEYTFDIAVNRDIAYTAFKAYPSVWKMISKSLNSASKNGNEVGEFDFTDIDSVYELSAFNDDRVEFIEYILPKMVALCKDLNDVQDSVKFSQDFMAYCDENFVKDEVVNEIYGFVVTGFFGAEGNQKEIKKPKLKVKFTMR